MVLAAACSGVAMLSPGDAAYGATFTFTTAGGDWLTAANWTPTGLPGSGDLAMIRTNTGADFTLNAAAMTVGAILDDTSLSRTLSNATADATNSTLTLAGLAGIPLIQMTRAASTTLLIQGPNGGAGSGTLGLVLASGGDLRVVSGATLSISADVTESGGPHSIAKVGGGTVALSGTNTLGGAISLNEGTIKLDYTANNSNKLASTASLLFNGGNVNANGNSAGNVAQSVNGMNLVTGQSTVTVDVSGTGQLNSTLAVGAINRSTGATVNINLANNGVSGGVAALNTTAGNDSFGILGGWGTVNGADFATVDGSNNVVAYSGYAAKDDISTWAANDNITNSAGFTNSLGSSLTIGSLRFSAGASDSVTIAAGQTLTIGSGGILLATPAGAAHSITGGSITSGNGADLVVYSNTGKTLTIDSTVVDNGATSISVTKSGSGSLQLLGAHNFTGAVYINSGSLAVNTLGDGGVASGLGMGSGDAAPIYIGRAASGNLVYSGGTVSTNRSFVLGAGGATFRLPVNSRALTLTGNISGPGSLTKAGVQPTTLVIQGAKTYAGTTSINLGTLVIDALAPIGSSSSIGTGLNGGTVTIGSGNPGTLLYNGSSAATDRPLELGSAGGGSSNIVVSQATTTATFDGPFYWNSGTPSAINGTSITFSVGANNVRPLNFDAAGTIIFNGNLGGTSANSSWGQVRKNGSGTLVLNGTNTYALGTTVNAGTLVTATNFSNGTITNVGATVVTGLLVNAGAARVAQKGASNDPAGTTVVPSLTIGASALLDLTNNAMVIDYTGGSPFSTIKSYLATGYAGGNWNGLGIQSSAANANNSIPGAHVTALGYAESATVFGSFPATFAGASVDNSAVLVRYVHAGDANLDGTVDTVDFNLLASNFSAIGKDWSDGDFNYDGTVDSIDFNLLASNFSQVLAADVGSSRSFAALVPEPASSCGAILLCAGLMRRRRR